jgi:hypothetical protein
VRELGKLRILGEVRFRRERGACQVRSGEEWCLDGTPNDDCAGGIDVYRNSRDDPVELNKDWYAVVAIPGTDTMFLVEGPFKDDEHWLNEIPKRLRGAEILGVPKKPNDE